MTEDEAKTKMCCGAYIIAAALAAKSILEGGETPPPAINGQCIASACMAWREAGASTADEPRGFCGLAGAPWS